MLVLAEADASARDALAMRWARVAALGLQRDGDAYPTGPSGAELAERRASFESIFREEHALLAPMVSELAARSVAALLSDASGVILSAHDGGAFTEHATRVRLVEGSDWSERARGTNAIGTAIVEGAPVAVIGAAHYERRNAGLFCYAAPIFDARGELVAVLDVSGPLAVHDRSFGVAVRTAVAAVERSLRALSFARAGFRNIAALERLVARAATPAVLVEPRGPVRVHNDLAHDALLRGRAVDCDALFGMSFASLEEMARTGGATRFETRDGAYDVALDPILDGDERALGIVVHFDPVPATPRRAPSSAPPRARTSSAPPIHEALPPAFEAIFAEDDAVREAKSLAATFAATSMPVLLLAETGTGKELFARAVHAASANARGPFVAINCGAVSPALLEAELFGYAPGAFTGAARTGSEGLLGAADGGTLFLDEIAEMAPPLQVALLRALDDGSYRRLGDAKTRRSTFRLVGATCRDLAAMVERGDFRQDLFFRIHGACVRLPALRNRADRVALARALLAREGAPPLAPSAIAHVQKHAWPGNVRELKSALAHAVALAKGAPIERRHFPEPMFTTRPEARSRGEVLRDAAEEALRASQGNVSEAARRMGVARDTLYRMLRRS